MATLTHQRVFGPGLNPPLSCSCGERFRDRREQDAHIREHCEHPSSLPYWAGVLGWKYGCTNCGELVPDPHEAP